MPLSVGQQPKLLNLSDYEPETLLSNWRFHHWSNEYQETSSSHKKCNPQEHISNWEKRKPLTPVPVWSDVAWQRQMSQFCSSASLDAANSRLDPSARRTSKQCLRSLFGHRRQPWHCSGLHKQCNSHEKLILQSVVIVVDFLKLWSIWQLKHQFVHAYMNIEHISVCREEWICIHINNYVHKIIVNASYHSNEN